MNPSPPGAKSAERTFATGWINDIYAGNSPYGAVDGQPLYGIYGPDYVAPPEGQGPGKYNTDGYNRPIVMGEAGATTLPAPPPVDVTTYANGQPWYEQGSVKQFRSRRVW